HHRRPARPVQRRDLPRSPVGRAARRRPQARHDPDLRLRRLPRRARRNRGVDLAPLRGRRVSLFYAAGIAAVIGCGLYLMLSRQIVRLILGVMLVSACVNLAIFLAGRLGPFPPPVIGPDETVLAAGAANPLPQALILTAIVIGFSLVAFV